MTLLAYTPFDIEKEGVGIVVPYYDSVAWEKAIRYIVSNPDEAEKMGQKARQLAESSFNLDICTREVAKAIKAFDKHNEATKVKQEVSKSTSCPRTNHLRPTC